MELNEALQHIANADEETAEIFPQILEALIKCHERLTEVLPDETVKSSIKAMNKVLFNKISNALSQLSILHSDKGSVILSGENGDAYATLVLNGAGTNLVMAQFILQTEPDDSEEDEE